MHRLAVAVVSTLIIATSAVAQNPPASDPFALTLAQQSLAALTGGLPITDVMLNANVQSIFGSDSESGTGTFDAKGTGQSRVDLNLSGGTRSDVRYLVNGYPAGAWSKNNAPATLYSGQNCWTDAAWFFPALSSLTQTANPNFIFKYIGQEQHGGVNTQHIRVFRIGQQDPTGAVQRLSATDFYLDTTSNVPLALAARSHADKDMNADIPLEVRFANYQAVSGFMVPFHFQQMLNGGVVLDVTVTSAVFNTGLQDSLFNLP
jgi:hypothetical protein